jgi:hypothetical protein
MTLHLRAVSAVSPRTASRYSCEKCSGIVDQSKTSTRNGDRDSSNARLSLVRARRLMVILDLVGIIPGWLGKGGAATHPLPVPPAFSGLAAVPADGAGIPVILMY